VSKQFKEKQAVARGLPFPTLGESFLFAGLVRKQVITMNHQFTIKAGEALNRGQQLASASGHGAYTPLRQA
jgi:hypothetical protein